MRKIALLTLQVFCLSWHTLYAQSPEFPNAIQARIKLTDYHALLDGSVKIGQGFDIGYYRNITPYLNAGVPFKLGLAKLPEKSGNTVTASFDVVAQLTNTRSQAAIQPYGFAGGGYYIEQGGKNHFQMPFGAGANFKITQYAFVNAQFEFRKAFIEGRDNIQFGAGFVFLLHKSEKPTAGNAAGLDDRDRDGVADAVDKCPDRPGPVAASGCPDRDGDGLSDKDDECPDDAGETATAGCPDYDKDGTADKTDPCPTEPGTMNGCPDNDRDGFADNLDKCPDQTGSLFGCPDRDKDAVADKDDKCPDEAGMAEYGGCAQAPEAIVQTPKIEAADQPDTDQDGVADDRDQCLTTPGTVNGCPDRDKDGIADKDDQCPDAGGSTNNKGCPEKLVEDRDKDGVPDDKDPCPDAGGTVNGCPDSDRDGLADKDDKCPTEPGEAARNGCPGPKDNDGDGLTDDQDPCPEAAGKLNGCPDSDGDNVADQEDRCPNEPGDFAHQGCPAPKDSDGDGYTDDLDPCPKDPGSPGGCPDRDKDGIPDKDDLCPEAAGMADARGCPKAAPALATAKPAAPGDRDGDGVADETDKCPNTPGPAENQGCPEVRKETKEKLAGAARAIRFETSRAVLKQESYAILDEFVDVLRQYPDYTLSIGGHTDDIGDETRNLVLSQARAKACYDYLLFRGIKTERLRHAGFGETLPVAENTTNEGRLLNRRVEFELVLQ
jgi:outer membrane protein OmpA-like peptidoglycan-associated protein